MRLRSLIYSFFVDMAIKIRYPKINKGPPTDTSFSICNLNVKTWTLAPSSFSRSASRIVMRAGLSTRSANRRSITCAKPTPNFFFLPPSFYLKVQSLFSRVQKILWERWNVISLFPLRATSHKSNLRDVWTDIESVISMSFQFLFPTLWS